jgi:hypothetical protein
MPRKARRAVAALLIAPLPALLWPATAQAECAQDAECPGSEICVSQQCMALPPSVTVAACTAHTDCSGSRICSEGRCVSPVSKPQPKPDPRTCTQDASCAGGEICQQGQCVSARQERAATPAPREASPPPVTASVPAVTATTGPPPAFGEGSPPPAFEPDSYRTESSGVTGLIVAGSILLPLGYAAGIAVTGAMAGIEQAEGGDVGLSAIPVAGSWISLVNALDNPKADTGFIAPLAVTGGLQATGLLLVLLGVSIRTEKRVPVFAGGQDDEGRSVAIAPTASASSAGFNAVGTF